MSRLLYLASNQPLEEQPNPYVMMLSINEALAKGIEIELDLFDKSVDRDMPETLMWVEDEEKLEYPEFCAIENREYYDEIITNKPYCVELSGQSNEKTMDTILSYIRKHATKEAELELWKVWLDEEIPKDFNNYLTYQKKELTAERVLDFIRNETYPQCMLIRE